MKLPSDNSIGTSSSEWPSTLRDSTQESSSSHREVRSQRRTKLVHSENLDECSDRWGRLMIAARAGDSQAYERLLRELDGWLRSYYARRLPYPAAEDARQEALLAIHSKRHTYAASRSFGAWVAAIARYKWVDRVRDASRYSAVSLDEEIPIEDHGGAAISAATLDRLLRRLNPAQESAIRLVKLKGFSIARASGATGQSASLVKVNIHRGLKKLATLIS
jgi:RNA polymerase sigma factor (sigma-70 family)